MWDLMEEVIELIQTLYTSQGKNKPEFEYIPTSYFLPLNLTPQDWFFRWVDEIEPQLPNACIYMTTLHGSPHYPEKGVG